MSEQTFISKSKNFSFTIYVRSLSLPAKKINVNLKIETVEDNKFHENGFRNMPCRLMPKIGKWSDTLSKCNSQWS